MDGKPMYDHVLAAGSHEPKSFLTYLTVGLVLSALFAAGAIGLSMVPSSAGERLDAERAWLYTHSEAFWARWPNNRVFDAPYEELAAESARCERVIEICQGQRGTTVRPAYGAARESYDQSNSQIATYQHMLSTVHNAMNMRSRKVEVPGRRGPSVREFRYLQIESHMNIRAPHCWSCGRYYPSHHLCLEGRN
ncbi:hypothetical protein A5699_14530 [Mycobacterium sp. E802]|nr:hypothetical protein A5699_14530 [Mycobacterium sp. E802]